MYPLHRNDTGSFQELARASDVRFGQLSLLTVAPRCSRGGHYHTHKTEWFCCLHGMCHIIVTDVRTGEQGSIGLDEGNRELIMVNPYEAHTVLNHCNSECELLVISSEEHDPENQDTIKYEVKEARETRGEPVCHR